MTLTDAKILVLEKAIKWATDGGAYELVKNIVGNYMDAELTGEQKLAKVKEIVMPILNKTAPFVINLLIEVAVFALKSKLPIK